MKTRLWIILIFLMLLAGCGKESTPTPFGPNPTLLPVQHITLTPPPTPDPDTAARAYLDAWTVGDLETMYALLTPLSQDAKSWEDFFTHYDGIRREINLVEVRYEILSLYEPTGTSAEVKFRVTMTTALVGDIQSDTDMLLSLRDNQWRVEWDDRLVHHMLEGENYLSLTRTAPPRGSIYDRNGNPLAAYSEGIVSVYLDSSRIDPEEEDAMLSALSRVLGYYPSVIQSYYYNKPEGCCYPLGQFSPAELEQHRRTLENWVHMGVSWRVDTYNGRLYNTSGVAPHVTGYTWEIPEDQFEEYFNQGYRAGDRVGVVGLEYWAESYLGGSFGGRLYVREGDTNIATLLAETPSLPAHDIYTTLDKDLQIVAQQSLLGFNGAVVVMEVDTGRVLAMASSPHFDPNAFTPGNFNAQFYFDAILNYYNEPYLLNRAAQGQYQLGSVFKTIVFPAALESGLFSLQHEFSCGHTWNRTGVPYEDWTLAKGKPASGLLTFSEGLMRSCNPYYYEIGYTLYSAGMENLVPDLARNFGLGSPTGIEVIGEEDGLIENPENVDAAVQMGIGHGLLVTPLQVADYIAAIANGGTLYRPQLIETIQTIEGEQTFTFAPEEVGALDVSPENLQALRNAMVLVVANPRGTAYHILGYLSTILPLAGKTGTALELNRDPHAWFAGYSYANRAGKPDIAVVVLIEHIGEGSDYAAPIFRRIMQSYFGYNLTALPWESRTGVLATPEPEGTPSPDETETP